MRTIITDSSIGITEQTDNIITYSSKTPTGLVIYNSITGHNISLLGTEYELKELSENTINKNKDKYNACVSYGKSERNLILRSMIINNNKLSSYFLTDINKYRDTFDVLLEDKYHKKYNIEIKIRSISSKKWESDYISKKKYHEMMLDAELLDSIPLYCMMFSDNIMRVYRVDELGLEQDDFVVGEVSDYPGAEYKKKELSARIMATQARSIKIQ